MTLDSRLVAAAHDTRNRISGLTPRPVRRQNRWLGATVGAVATLVVVGMVVTVWLRIAPQAVDESLGATGTVVEASLQPTASLGELNRAMELASIDGRAISDLDVRSMVVDDTGTLWLAVAEPVEEGMPQAAQLFSYDGQQWRMLETPYPVLRGVLAGSKDALWVDTFEGIARFDGESWEQHTPDDGAPPSFVSTASIGPDGELWLYSIGFLFAESIDDPLSWKEHSRVTVFDGVEWRHWEARDEESMGYGFLALDSEGSAWVASTDTRWGEGEPGGIWRLADETWLQVWEHTKSLGFFSSLAVDGQGELWAAYREFVLHVSEDGAELYDATDGVGNQPGSGAAVNWQPTDIEIDDDMIWVATMGGGVSRFDGATWQTFDETHGLPSPEVAEIELGPDGKLWLLLGREGQQVVVYDTES